MTERRPFNRSDSADLACDLLTDNPVEHTHPQVSASVSTQCQRDSAAPEPHRIAAHRTTERGNTP